MSSNTNDAVAKVTGSIASLGGLDRFTAQMFDTSFISEVLGTGDALTIGVTVVGVASVGFLATRFGVVDLDDL